MSGTSELSDREREILRLLATGASNKEIAQQLFISANTVKVHLRNIFAKIGVASRTEAAMYAVSAGLAANVALPALETEPAGEDADTLAASASPTAIELQSSTALPRRLPAPIGLVFGVVALGLLALLVLFARQAAGQASGATPAARPQKWEAAVPLPAGRRGLAVAAYENMVYAVAGETGQGISAALARYDPARRAWQSLADKPTAVADVSAAIIGAKIYVPGGRLPSGQMSDALDIFDIRSGRWTQGAALPEAVSAYALAAFEGKLYLFGGLDGQHTLNTVYTYDPDQDAWRTSAPMPTARAFASAASLGDKIFVFGGSDGRQALDVNEAYTPSLDEASSAFVAGASGHNPPWSQQPALPTGRYGMGAAILADQVYLVGGGGNQALPSLVFSPQAGAWYQFDAPLDQPWSKLGLAAVGTRLFALGGETGGQPAGQVRVYQIIFSTYLPLNSK